MTPHTALHLFTGL